MPVASIERAKVEHVCSSPKKSRTAFADAKRVVYSLIIINKAGGLVYNRDFNSALNKVSVNDLLVLAGTFHGYFRLNLH